MTGRTETWHNLVRVTTREDSYELLVCPTSRHSAYTMRYLGEELFIKGRVSRVTMCIDDVRQDVR